MKFQLAFDLGNIDELLAAAEQTISFIDIIEVGTPMIMMYGMEPVVRVKKEFPELTVLADTKIMDAGAHEAKIAFDSGADIVTVMGITHDETILGAVKSAKEAGGSIFADMMCVTDIRTRAPQLKKLGAEYLCVHTAKDIQSHSDPYEDLVILAKEAGSGVSAIAGGINSEKIKLIRKYNPAIVVVGESVTGSNDIKAAAAEIREALDAVQEGR